MKRKCGKMLSSLEELGGDEIRMSFLFVWVDVTKFSPKTSSDVKCVYLFEFKFPLVSIFFGRFGFFTPFPPSPVYEVVVCYTLLYYRSTKFPFQLRPPLKQTMEEEYAVVVV